MAIINEKLLLIAPGVGLLGNSSTLAGRGDDGGTVGQNCGLVCQQLLLIA